MTNAARDEHSHHDQQAHHHDPNRHYEASAPFTLATEKRDPGGTFKCALTLVRLRCTAQIGCVSRASESRRDAPAEPLVIHGVQHVMPRRLLKAGPMPTSAPLNRADHHLTFGRRR